jgi:branched-chain amino acid transport system substrate-binding protein
MPLRGPSGADGRDVVDAARMALAAVGGKAGKLAVRARYLDDTGGSARNAAWSPAAVGANARMATEDTSAVAYIGDFESGASRTSEPITNAAHLLQVSPASTAVDLTRPFLGSDQLPAVEDQGGERTFGRVIGDDPAQAAAAAHWARSLGFDRVRVVTDGSAFGRTMATAFREAPGGPETTESAAPALYYAGLAVDEPASVGSFAGRVMGSDALLPPFNEGRYVVATELTSAAQDPAQLPSSGRVFAARFRARYGRSPGRYAAYGYEAMAVVIDSIRRAGSTGTERQPVVDEFFDTRGRDSVLGRYAIDPLGDTTLDRMSGYRNSPGGLRPVALLHAR